MAETGTPARRGAGRRPLPTERAHRHNVPIRFTAPQFELLRRAIAADHFDGPVASYARQMLMARVAERADEMTAQVAERSSL